MAVTKIGKYAFYNHPNIKTVRTSATTIEDHAFDKSRNLTTVDLVGSGSTSIGTAAFAECGSLDSLIIRSSSVSTLGNAHFGLTPIGFNKGGIYVPANLVSNYKSATNWKTYKNNIFSINNYPVDFSSISDSWEEIVSNTTTYANDYTVGDTKTLELTDGTKVYMQLVGINKDIKSSDHESTARMTWLCEYAPIVAPSITPTYTGWDTYPLRTYLRETILPLFPSVVKNAIVEVDKTFRCKSPNDETRTVSDTIWLPSAKELGNTDTTYAESTGIDYTDIISSTTARKKNSAKTWSACSYWTRSMYSSSKIIYVNSSGNFVGTDGAYGGVYLLYGFCI